MEKKATELVFHYLKTTNPRQQSHQTRSFPGKASRVESQVQHPLSALKDGRLVYGIMCCHAGLSISGHIGRGRVRHGVQATQIAGLRRGNLKIGQTSTKNGLKTYLNWLRKAPDIRALAAMPKIVILDSTRSGQATPKRLAVGEREALTLERP